MTIHDHKYQIEREKSNKSDQQASDLERQMQKRGHKLYTNSDLITRICLLSQHEDERKSELQGGKQGTLCPLKTATICTCRANTASCNSTLVL